MKSCDTAVVERLLLTGGRWGGSGKAFWEEGHSTIALKDAWDPDLQTACV